MGIALARLGQLCPVATTVKGILPVPEPDAKNTLIQSDAWSLQGRLSHNSYKVGHSKEDPVYDSAKCQ